MCQAWRTDARAIGDIGEKTVSIIVVDAIGFVLEVRDRQVEPAVVINVAKDRRHAGVGRSHLVECNSASESDIFECTIPVVAI